MTELNLEKFNPTVAEIQKVVDEGKTVTITDFSDKAQVKLVRDHRIRLKEIRVAITKHGKALRQEAVDFQKAVIAKEKELTALVEPEEERLSELEEKAEAFEEREKRRELLPKRLARIADIDSDLPVKEDDILDMDSTEFEAYCNKLFADKNERDRQALEAKERVIKEAEAKAEREKEIREAEERARADERKRAEEAEVKLKEERERAEKESKERIAREEQEAKDRIARAEQEAKEKLEREERERKEKAEAEAKAEAERKEKLAKDKKYQEFLTSHGYSEEVKNDYIITNQGSHVILFKKVGELNL